MIITNKAHMYCIMYVCIINNLYIKSIRPNVYCIYKYNIYCLSKFDSMKQKFTSRDLFSSLKGRNYALFYLNSKL